MPIAPICMVSRRHHKKNSLSWALWLSRNAFLNAYDGGDNAEWMPLLTYSTRIYYNWCSVFFRDPPSHQRLGATSPPPKLIETVQYGVRQCGRTNNKMH